MARAVVLYTKPGCHLCDEALALLDELAPAYGLAITSVDITTDASLFERYRYEIPVVVCEGREVAKGRIAEARLVDALRRSDANG
ncbi:MAG: glutaredoxin family protein [Vicinamibacteria bacterium]